ncbi:MAG: FecR domain-containing protein [Planctomycetes bacterium]|nr:FecR domain-containing protein [Planctomycetota bacterium]
MIDNDARATQPVIGAVLVSYALGELDAEEQSALEKKMEQAPGLRDELEEIRNHLRLHQEVRKVAPRRGSFERLRARMKREGSLEGAVPGAHCMARRAFVASAAFGVVAVALLVLFTGPGDAPSRPDVIGQIVYHNPSLVLGQRRAEIARNPLLLYNADASPGQGDYKTGSYDAFLWLPTGQANTYSSVEVTQNSEFRFTGVRTLELIRGSIRRLEVRPGGIADGAFTVRTPHGRIELDEGGLAVTVTRDDAQTQVTVMEGSARVFGANSDNPFQLTSGFCTSIERGKLPNPPRPMLELLLAPRPNSEFELQATLVNTGFVAVKIARAYSRVPVYLLHVAYTAEYEPGQVPENTTLPPTQVTPKPESGESPADHRGETWLEPGKLYTFTFDVSPTLMPAPRVEFWLRLEYRGDLYAPPGQARTMIHSRNLRIDMRNR